jgi:protein O-GlcNAc transferase
MNATPETSAASAPSPDEPGQALADADAAWRQGDRSRAIAALEALANRAPRVASVHARLGAYLLEAGRYEDAGRRLDAAVALAPEDAAAWTNLGVARLRLRRVDAAIDACRRACALDPSGLGARVNLGNALEQAGDVDGAVAALEAARAIDPESAEVANNLGNLYRAQGRFEDAFSAYDAARRAWPGFRLAWSNLLALTKLSPRHSPAEIYALHRAFAAHFEPEWRASRVPAVNVPDPGRKLRLGYLSPDCHTALPAFVEPVLRRHDRGRFEIFAYFNNPQPEDALARLGPVTARVMRGATDAEVARWIREDGIDVLVDIAGHTGHNRLGVLGRTPAPVQVTWLDYLDTTGLDAVDLRLTDAVADPPGATEAFHSETLVRLAPAQWCWTPPAAERSPSPLPMLATGHPTLGSFNNGAKLTDETLALWAHAMQAIPDARLTVVGVPAGRAQARALDALGDAAARTRVIGRVAPDAFRREIAAVDVALDPRPFSGATTTLEMLWQGVPVVTWPGARSPSRSTASILSALGLHDWIARNADDHAAILRRAVADPGGLAALRAALPARLGSSPLCDAPAFTRGLEAALIEAWRSWCARRPGTAPAAGAAPAAIAAAKRFDADARLAGIGAAYRTGDVDAAVDEARALIDAHPEWQSAHRAYLQALLAWARQQPDLVARTFPPPQRPSRAPRVSIVICSIDPRKFDAVTASCRERFAGIALEILGVHDARSLAEAYNRAAERATGDILVFSHDDVLFATPDFGARLLAHLERHDGIGVAGASKVTGPSFDHAGTRHVHGNILHPAPAGLAGARLMALGFQQPVCEGIRALDGVFLAVRRHVWESHRFDPDRYDGFHLYDLDFTWRASGAGARLAVPLDLLLVHHSTGRYDARWRRYARRFVAQVGLDPLAPPPPGSPQARLDTLDQVDLLRAALLHFRFGADLSKQPAARAA